MAVVNDELKVAVEHMSMFTQELKGAVDNIYEAQLEKTGDGKHVVGENYEDLANHTRDVVQKLEAFSRLVGYVDGTYRYNRAFNNVTSDCARLSGVNMEETLNQAAELVTKIEEMTRGDFIYLTYPDPHDGSKADTHKASETIPGLMVPAVNKDASIVQQLIEKAVESAQSSAEGRIARHEDGGKY